MNIFAKIVLYIVLIAAAVFFGKRFVQDYQTVNAAKARNAMSEDLTDVALPLYNPVEAAEKPESNAETNVPASEEESAETDPSAGNLASEAAPAPPRLGFYGGGFCFFALCFGLLAAWDISHFCGNRAVNALFNEDREGMEDDVYEAAETEWAKGDYLEAIRLLREYLAKRPRQQHAAIRIAEIYEKDLNNPLAAALEYEEILQKKLPRERWGWAAIHLANLYSGPLEKPDQAITLLRRLDNEYGETQAAEKARRRLAMIESGSPPEDLQES